MAASYKLHTANGLRALESREKPYWDQLPGERGRAIGVRKTEHGVHWLCRSFDATTRKYSQVALPDARSFDEAKKMAAEVFKHGDAGGERTKMTFGQFFDEHYCPSVKASTSHGTVRKTFGPLEKVKLCDLNARHVGAWRNSDLFTKDKDDQPRPIGTLRRMAAPVRAALNKAVVDGLLPDTTWRDKIRFVQSKVEAAQTTTEDSRQYLTIEQRRALIEHADAEFKLLLTVSTSMPVRPGDFPAANVKDFDAKAGTVFLSTKDHPRHAKLAPKVVALLAEHAEGRKPNEPLFTIKGKRWHRNQWNKAISDAAERANKAQAAQGIPEADRVPLNATMYDLRHSAITDLIESGVSIAQVAFIAATSIAMIDANYRKALAAVQKSALEGMADAIIV